MTVRETTVGMIACLLVGCGGGAAGDLDVRLGAEETIANGIEAGDGEENIVDGWNLTYDKFIVAVGDIRVARSGASEEVIDEVVRVIDLVQAPPGGSALTSFAGLDAARWDRVSYALVAPTVDATRDANVGQPDFDAMVAGGCSYLIEGTITPAVGSAAQSTPPGGASRTVPATGIGFAFCVPATVRFIECQSDALPGVAIPSGGTATAVFTLHGDHIVFPSFDDGAEIVERRAQWLVNGDTNGDDVLTQAELTAITGADLVTLFPTDLDPGTPGNQGYSLANAPGGPITNAFGFVVAQLRTQGHLNGEGECEAEPIAP